jgi:glycosyltransferase involved in cell wall biosynthesis
MYKILLLSPCDIFPPVHGSSTAIYYTIKHLAQNHRIAALLCRLYSQRGPIDLAHPHLSIHYARESPLDRLGYKGLLINPFYLKAAREIAASFRPDIIQAELLWTAPTAYYLKRSLGKPVILVQENVEYLKFKRMGLGGPPLSLVRHLERWGCHGADKIVALSEVDKGLIVELYGISPEKVTVIPHCVDLETFAYRREGAALVRERLNLGQAFILTFVGKLDYIPNERAVRYIAEEVRPAVLSHLPEAVFLIIGQNYEDLTTYADEHLLFTGFVDGRKESTPNLADYLSASDLVLVPLDSGSGTRVKILEAAACARPIVSTRIGAEGQDFVHGREILLTEGLGEEFIEAVLALLKDEKMRKALGESARERVVAQYGWEMGVREFERLYERLEG